MKEVWSKRSAVNVIDGHKDYLQDLARIASPSFRPSQQDILLARVKTTQVVMERYRIDGIEFEMYDVGGQRSERRKWIDCFEGALSEFQNLADACMTTLAADSEASKKSKTDERWWYEDAAEGAASRDVHAASSSRDVHAEDLHSDDYDEFGPP